MTTQVRFKWNPTALREARTSPAAQEEVLRRARRIAEACGGEAVGFVAAGPGEEPRVRARAAVIAASRWARRANAKHNTILRNIDAGRS